MSETLRQSEHHREEVHQNTIEEDIYEPSTAH